jgi:hypothetical protein
MDILGKLSIIIGTSGVKATVSELHISQKYLFCQLCSSVIFLTLFFLLMISVTAR